MSDIALDNITKYSSSMKTAFVLLITAATSNASSWPPLHHGFTCKESPAGISGFDPTAFAGTWFLQKSTMYNKEKYGCYAWALSDKNSNDKILSTTRYMATFDWWPFWYDIGQAYAEDATYGFEDDGTIVRSALFPNKKVIFTDYNNYAVVYECSLYIPHVLNMRAD